MKPMEVDPEYQRYRRSYPKFPGVSTCVELLRRRNVQGAYLDGVMGDLLENASENVGPLLAAFGAETEVRVRSLLLSVIAEARAQAALPVFAAILMGGDEELHVWAARGLHVLGTADARETLWQARARQLSTPAETERFHHMLEDVGKWK